MKLSILPLLSITSAALASPEACPVNTVTVTEYQSSYETVKAVTKNVKPSCSRRTVTTTTIERVYVTVTTEDVGYSKQTPQILSTALTDAHHPSVTYSFQSAMFSSSAGGKAYSSAYTPVLQSKTVSSVVEIGKSTQRSADKPADKTVVPQNQALQSASPENLASSTNSGASVASSSTPESSKAATPLTGDTNTGQATFYGGNVDGGMCSFAGYTLPSGIFGTALSDSNWAGASNCGSCLQVTGPNGNKITAMVVDQCPGCGDNHLDLFPDAFSQLADPSKGVIPVSWEIVPCGITSPIVLKNKEGTSEYWFSMEVVNSNVPVSALEVSIDGGATWQSTTRMDYNYFENSSGFGVESVDIKVTSVDGGSIIVNSVSVASSSTSTAGSNFS